VTSSRVQFAYVKGTYIKNVCTESGGGLSRVKRGFCGKQTLAFVVGLSIFDFVTPDRIDRVYDINANAS